MRTLIVLLLLGCLLAASPQEVEADGDVFLRVSVKFILDGSGNRAASGNFNTDAVVLDAIDFANDEVLAPTRRGYRLALTELVDVAGISQWFDTPVNSNTRGDFEEAAESDPSLYVWRSNQVNVYILGNDASSFNGFCSRTEDAILLDQGASKRVFLHELGHYFNLCHTHGCECQSCGPCAEESDEVADTILDDACWVDEDDIAQGNFGMNFTLLSPSQQLSVLQIRDNVMSLHDPPRNILTLDQMDRLIDAANGFRSHVVTGATVFVSTGGSGSGNGTSANPFPFIADAVDAAVPGSIVLLNTGLYPPNLTIFKPLILRSTRGSAIVGVE